MPGATVRVSGDSSVGNKTSYPNLIPNPLRDFNTYNYIITLGQLSRNYFNDPVGYTQGNKNNFFEKILLRSGGGALKNRVITHPEVAGNNRPDGLGADIINHAEYYIEDLEISAIVDLNERTGSTVATTVSFTVVEPYSIGLFLQAIKIGAKELGYSNYKNCPVAIKIDFVGWNDDGEEFYPNVPPIVVALKVTNIGLTVSEQGSKYEVEAVYYSEIPLSDRQTRVPTDISASGRTVHQILQGEEDSEKESVIDIINNYNKENEDEDITYGGDRRLILFPKPIVENTRRDGMGANISEVDPRRVIHDALGPRSSASGRGSATQNTIDNAVKGSRITVGTSDVQGIYDKLAEWAKKPENINEIGKSKFFESSQKSYGPQEEPSVQNGVIARNTRRTGTGDNIATAQFTANSSILEIIKQVIVQSEYYEKQATEKNKIDDVHRIETVVFIENDVEFEKKMGRPRYLFVYMVYPMAVGNGMRALPTVDSPITSKEINSVKKQYNYYYTGKNEDIISFDLNFPTSYYTMGVSFGAEGSVNGDTIGNDEVLEQGTIDENLESADDSQNIERTLSDEQQIIETSSRMKQAQTTGGLMNFGGLSYREKISNTVLENVLNTVDMISFDIEIWGDPYFLPLEHGDSTFYISEEKRQAFMTYMNSFVYVDITFNTLFDYNQNTGLVDDKHFTKSPFSGLCRLNQVTSKFSGGQFKQTLNILRIPNQKIGSSSENPPVPHDPPTSSTSRANIGGIPTVL